MMMKLILQLHASTFHPFPDLSTSIHHIHGSMPRPASKCFMALVVSVLCAVSPRITVDTSLISLCTSKNRELRKLTTPEEWRRVRSGCVFLEIIQSQINPNGPMDTHPIWFIFLYFTFSEKMNFGTFQISLRWFISKLVNCSIGYVFSKCFSMQYLDPKIAKEFQDLWVCRKDVLLMRTWWPSLAYVAWRRNMWSKLGRRWTWCLTSIICKGWLGRCLSMAELLEQWKKSWLFRAYRGLYSPNMWGLS